MRRIVVHEVGHALQHTRNPDPAEYHGHDFLAAVTTVAEAAGYQAPDPEFARGREIAAWPLHGSDHWICDDVLARAPYRPDEPPEASQSAPTPGPAPTPAPAPAPEPESVELLMDRINASRRQRSRLAYDFQMRRNHDAGLHPATRDNPDRAAELLGIPRWCWSCYWEADYLRGRPLPGTIADGCRAAAIRP